MNTSSKLLLSLLGIVIILIVGTYFLDTYVENKIQQQIDNTDRGYTLEIDEYDFKLWSRSLTVHNMAYSDSLRNVHLKNGVISGFSYWQYLMNQNLQIDQIYADSLVYLMKGNENSDNQKSQKTAHISNIKVDYALITSAPNENDSSSSHIISVDKFKSSPVSHFVKDLEIDKNKFSINHIAVDISIGSGMFPESGTIRTGKISVLTSDNLYSFNINKTEIDVASQSGSLDSVALSPLLGKLEFADKKGYRKGRVDLTLSRIDFSRLNVEKLINDRALIASKISLIDADCNIFYNLNKPKNEHKERKIISQFIQGAPFEINVDTVSTTVSYIKLELPNKQTGKIGYIDFKKSYLSAYNVSNVDSILSKNPHMDIDIVSQFMGKGKVNGHFSFDLTDKSHYSYNSTGELEEMDIESINTILIPIANLNIKAGQNHKLAWDFQGSNKNYDGSLEFAYEQLEIEVLSDDQKNKKILKSWIAGILVKKDNLLNSEEFNHGEIGADHNKTSSFFSNLWSALQSGIVTTIISGEDMQERFLDKVYE